MALAVAATLATLVIGNGHIAVSASALGILGLVIAIGSRMADGLPHRFVLLSGAMLPLVLLNVPLSIVLVTHGAAMLFLLWYVTPRSIFRQDDPASAC